jgi:hypothetical protein
MGVVAKVKCKGIADLSICFFIGIGASGGLLLCEPEAKMLIGTDSKAKTETEICAVVQYLISQLRARLLTKLEGILEANGLVAVVVYIT